MLSAGGAFVGIFILKMAIKITWKYTPGYNKPHCMLIEVIKTLF